MWPQGIGELPTQATKRIPKPLDPNIFDLFFPKPLDPNIFDLFFPKSLDPNIFDLFAFRTPEPEYIWVYCMADCFTERYLRI